MAKSAGRIQTIYFGLTSPGAGGTPTSKVGGIFDPDDDPQDIKADSTSNDSAGEDEHEIIGGSRSGSFKFYRDRADAGQNLLIQAQNTKVKGYLAIRELGDGSTLPQELMQVSIRCKRSGPLRALTEYTCSWERSGATDTTAQT